ncbi:MAG: Uma2 family endonuclease [Cytophagales bacterium]|jgi:Uma2 family endonuclease|nr:Uma2 family endonuclease [Cytophagales bacterium]MCA6365616.1 Uma2 family endonuclease [Cytophagales bacterium]MCA6373407.1 Uma2 family endonuclease [Cytophagales bacterium]MCA6377748.1 Uma2 family endonuclease [Cytophagales bacterium]MCA6383047.1 Uma2 family endonuclease [Cytophagales bacterium]
MSSSSVSIKIPKEEQLSDEWLFEFCMANKELRIERDPDGKLLIMAPVGLLGSSYNNTVASLLWVWNQKSKKGITFDSSAGFRLPNKAMRSPDAAWISNERWKNLGSKEKRRIASITPDFVIELRSESDSLAELKMKMKEWIQNGCKLAWLIDPIDQRAYIYRSSNTVDEIRSFDQALKAKEIIAGFSIDLSLLK